MEKQIIICTDMIEIERKRKQSHLDAWNNLPHFENIWDIPKIPIVDNELYKTFYIPRLIASGAIPKKDLIDQQVYIGSHRRCTVARWNQIQNVFEYHRNKFGGVFIDTCNHFENDNGYSLFIPIKLATEEEWKLNKQL